MSPRARRRGVRVSGLMAVVGSLALLFASVNVLLHPDVTVMALVELSGGPYDRERLRAEITSDSVLNRALALSPAKDRGRIAESLRRLKVGGDLHASVWYEVTRSPDPPSDEAMISAVSSAFIASRPRGTASLLMPPRSYSFPRYDGAEWFLVSASGLLCVVTLIVVSGALDRRTDRHRSAREMWKRLTKGA